MSRLRQLSNAELIEQFERAYEQCIRCDWEPDQKARLNELNAEISRREQCGELGEDVWELPRH
jgi:hypothetical protein